MAFHSRVAKVTNGKRAVNRLTPAVLFYANFGASVDGTRLKPKYPSGSLIDSRVFNTLAAAAFPQGSAFEIRPWQQEMASTFGRRHEKMTVNSRHGVTPKQGDAIQAKSSKCTQVCICTHILPSAGVPVKGIREEIPLDFVKEWMAPGFETIELRKVSRSRGIGIHALDCRVEVNDQLAAWAVSQ